MWLGSALALILALVVGLGRLDGLPRALLAAAGGIYLLGVQLPTLVVNVPLNNELQEVDVDAADDAACGAARRRFESRWNRWNVVRTVLAVLTTILLLAVLPEVR